MVADKYDVVCAVMDAYGNYRGDSKRLGRYLDKDTAIGEAIKYCKTLDDEAVKNTRVAVELVGDNGIFGEMGLYHVWSNTDKRGRCVDYREQKPEVETVEQTVYVAVNGRIYALSGKVEDGNQDPWAVIEAHDSEYGTHFYDKLDESNVSGVGDRSDVEGAIDVETEDDIDWSDEATMVVSLRTEGRASIKCTVTELARRIGADVGDQVLITMKKL